MTARALAPALALLAACGPAQPSADTGDEAGSSSSETEGGESSSGTETSTGEPEPGTQTGAPEPEPETDSDDTDDNSPIDFSYYIPDINEQLCDGAALSDCVAEATDQSATCRGACSVPESCDAQACHWSCASKFYDAQVSCYHDYCVDELSDEQFVPLDCHEQALGCAEGESCEPHACAYELYDCVWAINHLTQLVLRFDYAGSCELQLPGPPVFPELSLLRFGEGGEPWYELRTEAMDCELAEVGGVWNAPDYDQVTLCPEQCEAFMLDGVVRLDYGLPAP